MNLLRDSLQRARARAIVRSSSRSSEFRASARAASSPSCSRCSKASPSSSTGDRAAACPTGRASRSGRSPRWSRRTRASSRRTRRLEAEEKLSAVVTEALDGSTDRAWVEAHLRPLVGLAEDSQAGGDRRAEAFAAWRRFFEAMAERSPLVLVFEDLHWADDSLLDFIDHLVDWATGVPLLVVCTARPELLARRVGLGRREAERGNDLALAALGRRHRAARARAPRARRSRRRGADRRSSPGRAATLSTRRSSRGWSRTWGLTLRRS